MIKFAVRKWDENRDKLAQELWKDREGGYTYKELLKKVVTVVLNEGEDEEEGNRYSADKITEIDDGKYQGTLLFLIPEDTYEPEEYAYLMTYVNYGSCGCCDVLQHYNDMEYEEEERKIQPGERVKGYLSICRTLLCNMIKPYNTGWRETEDFEIVRWEQTKEEKAADEKVVEEAQARYAEGTLDEEWDKADDTNPWARRLWKNISREAGKGRYARSVRSLLEGGHERERRFQKIIEEVLPGREDFVTVSGKKPFSGEYELKVPAGGEGADGEEGKNPARTRREKQLAELIFDYIVRAWMLEIRSRTNVGRFDMENLQLHHIPLIVQAREETRAGFRLVKKLCGEGEQETLRERRRRSLEALFLFTGEVVSEEEAGEKMSRLWDGCFFLARLKQVGLTGSVTPEDLYELLEDRGQKLGTRQGQELLRLLELHTDNFPSKTIQKEKLILDFEANTGMRGYTGSLEEGGAYVSGDTLYVCSLAETSVWNRREAARLLAFYLLNLCCLAEGVMDRNRKVCSPKPMGRGYRERIIRKIGIFRARFGEVEICDLSRLNQRNLLTAAAELAQWNGRDIPDEIWELFLIGEQIYTSGLVGELLQLPFTAKRDILRVMGDTGAFTGMYTRSWWEDDEEKNIPDKKSVELGAEFGESCISRWRVEREERVERGGGAEREERAESGEGAEREERAESEEGVERRGGTEEIYVSAKTWDNDKLNLDDMALLEARYHTSGKMSCLRVGLDRGELLEILTWKLPLRGVYSFKRGENVYDWEVLGEEFALPEKDREAPDRLGRQLAVFHDKMDFIEELIIVENFFERGEERRRQEEWEAGREGIDYRTRPYVIFRDEKKVVMARECLAEENRYTIALMRLYEDKEEFRKRKGWPGRPVWRGMRL